MALTKISGSVIKDSVSLSGNVSVGGTLTYQDVTNVDALGIGTFRTGINVSGGQIDVGSNIKIGNAGVITATSFVGGLPITGGADNRVITASSASAIQGESNLTFNGSTLDITSSTRVFSPNGNVRYQLGVDNSSGVSIISKNSAGSYNGYQIDASAFTVRTTASNIGGLGERFRIDSGGQVGIGTNNPQKKLEVFHATQGVIRIRGGAGGSDSSRKADLSLFASGAREYVVRADASDAAFKIVDVTGSNAERLRIDSSGRVLIGTTDPGGVNADDLTVATSGNTGITIRSGTSNTGNIFFSDATSGAAQYAGAIEFHHSTDSLNLNVGNTAIVRIVKDSTTPAVGVGILPQAGQYNGWTVLQIGESAALTSNRTTADTNQTELSNNSYLNSNASAYKYHHADEATRYVQSHGRHTFYSAASGSADANITFSEVMKIDASGRVTKPLTPAFLAYHHGYDVNYTPNQTLPYQFTVFNTGNHYNTSNSTFTAPVAGRYLFSANANGNYSSSYSGIPRAYWKINGSNPGNAIHLRGPDSTDQGLEQRSQTVIFNLAANDTVKIVVGQNQWDLFGANSFTGYLIG